MFCPNKRWNTNQYISFQILQSSVASQMLFFQYHHHQPKPTDVFNENKSIYITHERDNYYTDKNSHCMQSTYLLSIQPQNGNTVPSQRPGKF